MEIILLCVLIGLALLNLIVLVVIGAFLVRFRDRTNNIFADLIQAMEVMWGAVPVAPTSEPTETRPKTWDEKYEEELDAMTRRLRADSGLVNLPDPGLSWGAPPAPNAQNEAGMSVKDVDKTPMRRES
jgi:hypothetical protein